MVRGIVSALRSRGLVERVCARLDPARAALVRTPPVASAWVLLRDADAVCEAVSLEVGPGALREFHRAAIRAELLPLFEPFVRGLLRLFGASPHAIFSRLPEVHARAAQGHSLEYERTGERSCVLRSEYVGAFAAGPALLESTRAAADVIFDLCDTRGTVSETIRAEGPGARTQFRWDLRW